MIEGLRKVNFVAKCHTYAPSSHWSCVYFQFKSVIQVGTYMSLFFTVLIHHSRLKQSCILVCKKFSKKIFLELWSTRMLSFSLIVYKCFFFKYFCAWSQWVFFFKTLKRINKRHLTKVGVHEYFFPLQIFLKLTMFAKALVLFHVWHLDNIATKVSRCLKV